MKDKKNTGSEWSDFGVVILAGGKSSRMDYPKPWLMCEDGSSFVDAISRKYSRMGAKEIVVVLNADFAGEEWTSQLRLLKKTATVILNHQPERGRLYSLMTGVNQIQKSGFLFVHNVDNPMIKNETLDLLRLEAEQGCVCVPEFNLKTGHPIVADTDLFRRLLLRVGVESTLREMLSQSKKKRIVVNDSGILVNINDIKDYEAMLNGVVA